MWDRDNFGEYMPRDYGERPYVTNLYSDAVQNENFRTALWTGKKLQLTLMCIQKDGEIGLEKHEGLEQFLYVEAGMAYVMMGKRKNSFELQKRVGPGSAIFIPADTWHNVVNIGNCELKLFSIYAPSQHPFGTVQAEKPSED